MSTLSIGITPLHLPEIEQLLTQSIHVSEDALQRIERCREYLNRKMDEGDKVYYGINTGFGALCTIRISNDDIEQLQENLVLSHACGIGNEVPSDIVRIMLLLKIKNFCYGNSGVSVAVVQRLVDFYNQGIYPVVFQLGSLGASGDLAPLAHLSLPLLGEGDVYYRGAKQKTADLYAQLGWKKLPLQSKEGLALLNGTQFMNAYAIWCVLQVRQLVNWADMIAAMSFDGFDCTPNPLQHKSIRLEHTKVR
jgi:histidine ammonia-lyase